MASSGATGEPTHTGGTADAAAGADDLETTPGQVFWFDGKGRISATRPAQPAPKGFSLVLLSPEAAGCLEWLSARLGRVTAEALVEENPRPHCTVQDDGILLSLVTAPVLERRSGERQQHAVFWIERGRVIAVTKLDVNELLGNGHASASASAPTSPVHIVVRVALRAADRLEPHLDKLSEKVDDLEEEVLRRSSDRTRVRLNALRRAAIMLRRTLLPQRDALTTLETASFSWFTQRDRSRLREAVGWLTRLGAEAMSFSERAALVQDDIMDRRAEQVNRALLILAAVTTIFMPLTLITGLIGMNVAGIPFAREPWAFPALVGILVLIGALEYLWFRSRKWL